MVETVVVAAISDTSPSVLQEMFSDSNGSLARRKIVNIGARRSNRHNVGAELLEDLCKVSDVVDVRSNKSYVVNVTGLAPVKNEKIQRCKRPFSRILYEAAGLDRGPLL